MGNINFDRPVKTANGHDVRILCTDGPGVFPIVGIAADCVKTWTRDGLVYIHDPDSPYNLVNVPENRSVWINIYDSKNSDGFHRSKSDADLVATPNRLACIEISYQVPVK